MVEIMSQMGSQEILKLPKNIRQIGLPEEKKKIYGKNSKKTGSDARSHTRGKERRDKEFDTGIFTKRGFSL